MPKLADIAKAANDYLISGKFKPDVLPGCANFVSHCMANAGGPLMIVSYVPYLVDKCEKIPANKLVTGMLVVFERTYDAVAPEGVGPEDDMTHIGVYVGDGYFIDYGGSPAGVRKQKLEGWWKERVQFYLKPPGFEGAQDGNSGGNSPTGAGNTGGQNGGNTNGNNDFHNIKLFYHPAVPQVRIIIDGNEKEEDKEYVDEMMLSIRTSKNRELFLLSHKFEQYPYLNMERDRGRVKALEWHLKWEG